MYGSEIGYYHQLNSHQQTPASMQPPPLTSLTTPVLPPVLCLVCNSRKPCPSVRSKSATICEACKKFFLRHRDIKVQQALQCATGRRDCDVTVTAKRPCSACRLAKCFNIGMRFEDYPMRTKASKRSLSSNVLSPSQQRQLKQQQEQQNHEEADEEESEDNYGKRTSPGSASTSDKSSPSPPVRTGSVDASSSSGRSSGGEHQATQQDYDEIFDLTASAAASASSMTVARFTPIPDQPAVMHSYAEDFLRKSLRALTELTAFETLPLRRPIGQIPDENTWWKLKMEHFQAAARSATAYVRQLPAFTTIPLSDRPVLFANALYPLLIADLALPSQPRGLSFLGMNERNRAEFLRFFSEFQMLSEDVNRITEVFSQWCPTMFEFAILAALLFYEPCFPGLQSVDMVRKVNDQLKTVLRIYLPQHCSNPKLVNWRLQQFEVACGMLRRASVDHCLAIEMLARRRPGFVSMNELFFEVFTHTQRAVNMMTQQRQNNGAPLTENTAANQQQLATTTQPAVSPSSMPTPLYPTNDSSPPPTTTGYSTSEPLPVYQDAAPSEQTYREAQAISALSEPLPAYQPPPPEATRTWNPSFESAFAISFPNAGAAPEDEPVWQPSTFNF